MVKESEPHLIILRLSALGDVAMCVPVLLALRRTHPQLQITFVTKAAFFPVVSRVPGVETIKVETRGIHKGLRGLYRLSKTVKRMRPDALADLHNVLRSRILRLFMSGTGMSFGRLDKGRAEKRALTRAVGKRWAPLTPMYLRYCEVFKALGWPVEPRLTDVLPRESLPGVFKSKLRGGRRVGLAPFAAHPGKCYPEVLMREVIRLLQEQNDIHFYLFGGGTSEVARLRQWEAEFPNCTAIAGLADLDAELALISQLDLMVSMDSGNGHLAAMFGIPVLTLWGVTHPYAGFAPFGQGEDRSLLPDRKKYPQIPTSVYGNKMPSGYENVMETIPPERVCSRILELLTGL